MSSVYSSSKVTKDYTLLVASLSLQLGLSDHVASNQNAQEVSFSSETDNHPGEKWLGNTTIVSIDIEMAITVLLKHMTVLSKANCISFIPKFKHENRTKR